MVLLERPKAMNCVCVCYILLYDLIRCSKIISESHYFLSMKCNEFPRCILFHQFRTGVKLPKDPAKASTCTT